MFDQTFVDGTGKTNKSWTVGLSILGEFAGIGLMILVPLIWTEVLPKSQSLSSLTAPAPPPPPAPPAPAQTPPTRKARTVARVFTQVLEVPHTIPPLAAISEDVTPPLPSPGEPVGGIPGAGPGTAGINFDRSGIFVPPPPPSSPKPSKEEAKPRQDTPLPVGGNVQTAKLIKHPAPVYPAIAKSARIQGTVVLQAIIGKDGTVRNLMVVSAASPLLVPAAMDAVKQWLYQPTLLNQEPVEVITEITVIFSLQ
jgi:protein TonB